MRHAKILILVLVLSVCGGTASGEKVAAFTDFVNPDMYRLHDGKFYVSEDAVIFIYSMKDFKLLKKFGREGEGPKEFYINRARANDMVDFELVNDKLIVNSWGKISYWSKLGEYISERRIPKNVGSWFEFLDNRIVGRKFTRGKNNMTYHHVVLYDNDFNPLKTIYSHIHGAQWRHRLKFNPLAIEQAFIQTCNNTAFAIDGARGQIIVYDHEGNKKFSAKNPDEPVKFTEQMKKDRIDSYKTSKFWSGMYAARKHLFDWPDYLNPIRWFYLDPAKNRLYMQAYDQKDNTRKYFVFDFNGKFIKRTWLPWEGMLRFNDGKIWQLKENEDTEEWELHVSQIK